MSKTLSEQQPGADIQPLDSLNLPVTIYPALSVPEVALVRDMAREAGVPLAITVGQLIRRGLEAARTAAA